MKIESSLDNLSGIEEQKSIFDNNGTPLRNNYKSDASPTHTEKFKLLVNRGKKKSKKEKFLEEFRLEIAENVSLYPELEFKPVDDSEDLDSYNKLTSK